MSGEDNLHPMLPLAAVELRPVDWVDVSGWGVLDGLAIPVPVCRLIAERINLYSDYMRQHVPREAANPLYLKDHKNE